MNIDVDKCISIIFRFFFLQRREEYQNGCVAVSIPPPPVSHLGLNLDISLANQG